MKQIGEVRLYDIKDLNEQLGVSQLTLRRYINSGRLVGRKLGNKWYVSEDNLREYFNNNPKAQNEAE